MIKDYTCSIRAVSGEISRNISLRTGWLFDFLFQQIGNAPLVRSGPRSLSSSLSRTGIVTSRSAHSRHGIDRSGRHLSPMRSSTHRPQSTLLDLAIGKIRSSRYLLGDGSPAAEA